MRNLEERRHAEGFGEVGTQAGKGVVIQEDALLHFLGHVLHRAGIFEPECFSSLREGSVRVPHGGHQGVVHDEAGRRG